jgi:hypothetical protein
MMMDDAPSQAQLERARLEGKPFDRRAARRSTPRCSIRQGLSPGERVPGLVGVLASSRESSLETLLSVRSEFRRPHVASSARESESRDRWLLMCGASPLSLPSQAQLERADLETTGQDHETKLSSGERVPRQTQSDCALTAISTSRRRGASSDRRPSTRRRADRRGPRSSGSQTCTACRSPRA